MNLAFIMISTLILMSVVAEKDLDLPSGTNTVAMLKSQDYPTEFHEVTTEDGYILTLHRIVKPGAPVMFLQHSLFSSSAFFVMMGPGHSIAQDLWDAGFDVWMNNARGNPYSRRHVTLNHPDDNVEYWDFSWHEMGVHDVPAALRYVLNATQSTKVNVVCHSIGCNMIFVLLSEKPKWNTAVGKIHAIAPGMFLTFNAASSPVLNPALNYKLEALHSSGLVGNELSLPTKSNFFMIHLCDVLNILCDAFYSKLLGPSPASEYQTLLIKQFLTQLPTSTSTKSFLHVQQLVDKDKFLMYDYGPQLNSMKYDSFHPPEYQLNNVDVPVYLYRGENDNMVQKQNIIDLGRQLGDNTQEKIWINADQSNHLGILFEGQLTNEIVKRT